MQRFRSGNTGLWSEIEEAGLPRQRRKSWQRSIQSLPRWAKCLFTGFLILCASLGFRRGCNDLNDQALKLYPTDYTRLQSHFNLLMRSPHPIRHCGGKPVSRISETWSDITQRPAFPPSIDDRYVYLKTLASGQEGKTALFRDQRDLNTVVIKIFHSACRNRLPTAIANSFANHTSTWPAEIEASLLLGGHSDDSGYVPVLDYFILQTGNGWSWALVTPFVAQGTLVHLSAKLANLGNIGTIEELHAIYRPTFEMMLEELRSLHSAGYCHDDVKPDNIFVKDPHHWLLGDLGNVRHIQHPWHGTRSWLRQNQWSDCAANDIRRAYKSYLWFLRRMNETHFDQEFWRGNQEWSREYWQFMERWSTYADHGGHIAMHYRAQATTGDYFIVQASTPSSVWSRRTERELLCTSIPRRLWDWSECFGTT